MLSDKAHSDKEVEEITGVKPTAKLVFILGPDERLFHREKDGWHEYEEST